MSGQIKWLYAFSLIVLFAAGTWVGSSFLPKAGDPALQNLGGDFTLSSVDGPVKLSDYKGKVVAIYFGFLSCPDICPTTLSTLSSAIRSLPAEQQANIQPLFISVDPERDGLDRLAEYTAFFLPNMLGLSGDLSTLETLVRQYGAYFRHIPLVDSALEYTVDHSSRIYVINKQSQLVTTLPHGTRVDDIAASLASYL